MITESILRHSWDLSPKEAIELQKELKDAIVLKDLKRPVQYVAGADVSFNKFEPEVYTGIVVLEYESMRVVAHSLVMGKAGFPYIPGLLSFREIPSLIEAWESLPMQPDIVMLDGHGIAHPRRMGIAAHFGLLAGVPSLGCAKKLLTGTTEDPETEKGSYTIIRKNEDILGWSLRTKNKVKPMFVSPGHLCSMEDCRQIALHCSRGYRMPEPTRRAHLLVNELRRGVIKPGSVLY